MSQRVSIESKHCIGNGASAWLFVGRIPGDDDDTAYLILADDESIAQASFEHQLYDDSEKGAEGQKWIVDQYGSSVIITTSQLLS